MAKKISGSLTYFDTNPDWLGSPLPFLVSEMRGKTISNGTKSEKSSKMSHYIFLHMNT